MATPDTTSPPPLTLNGGFMDLPLELRTKI